MSETSISQSTARKLMLSAQGLFHAPRSSASKADVLAAIRRMGALQIDTIHVVARSPYLVLFTRLGDYDPAWLDDLLAEKALFEYWSHAACFLPIEDYPLYRRIMLTGLHGWVNQDAWFTEHREVTEKVLSRIQDEGPLRSADFESNGRKGNGWWDWKEEKRALEHLHTRGDLMISARRKFQRVYDLRERILPDWRDENAPGDEAVRRELTLRAVRCMGISLARWVPDYFRLPKNGTAKILNGLEQESLLAQVNVEGWDEPGWMPVEAMPLLASLPEEEPTCTSLLSPFDPLIWDRERTRKTFNFDFSIECYLPAPKRRYGYFCLPILRRGELVGRADAKAHRAEKIFEIKTLYLEPGVCLDEALKADLDDAFQRAANWHQTPRVVVSNIQNL
jgi:uncharacterized protein YcaQ